jgi:succinylglutamate desuccinylase
MRLPEFEAAARRWIAHGGHAQCLADAVWQYQPPRAASLRLLLSAGVHGDETAPIEMLARRLPQWADAAAALEVELVLAIGNPDAVAAGRRFVGYDMNRMFASDGAVPAWGREGERARQLKQVLAAAMPTSTGTPLVHLDLHTTIRPSLKPTFAIVPGSDAHSPLLRWLGCAGLHAAVLNPGPGTTLSAWSAARGAASCTVELGRVGAFGSNDADLLAPFEAALDRLVRRPLECWHTPADAGGIEVYRVTRELIRSSEHFELMIPDTAPNFTPLAPGQLLARDRLHLVHARQGGECVLFPNRKVALGLRAGLLVAPVHEPGAPRPA